MSDIPPIEIPIDGVLDLHAFSPKDIKTLVPDYLEECQRRGVLEVRIIHEGHRSLAAHGACLALKNGDGGGISPWRRDRRWLGRDPGYASGGGVASIGSISPWDEASMRTCSMKVEGRGRTRSSWRSPRALAMSSEPMEWMPS